MSRNRSHLVLVCLLAFLLFLPFLPARAEVPSEWVPVAESEHWKLYLMEERLSIILENKQTGALLTSTLTDETMQGKNNKAWKGYLKSGLVLSVIRDGNNTYQADLVNNGHTLTYTYLDNGFTADVFWEEYGIGLAMTVTLEGDDLLVRIPDASVREELEGVYIATISPFPLLGATHLGDTEGYMLIPDGNGALIHLTNKEKRFSSGFSQLIWGSDAGFRETSSTTPLWGRYETVTDTNRVLAPVFGMAHTADQTAYLAVVEEGADRCSIEVQPNGVMIEYNRCFARFLLRDVYQQPLNQSSSGTVKVTEADRTHSDRAVRYCLLSGDDANYSGMAVRYRNYLLAKGEVVPREVQFRTRADLLACDCESSFIGTSPVVMTSVSDAREILSDLRSSGAGEMLFILRGWQKGGVNALPVDRYDPEGALGSEKEMTDFLLSGQDTGDEILPYVDALRVNAATSAFTFDAVKRVNKRTLEEKVPKQVYDTFYWLLPSRSGEKLLSLADSLKAKGKTGLAWGGTTENIFSWYLKGSYFSRADCQTAAASAAESLDKDFTLALETPFSFLWRYTDAFLDLPLTASDYMYVDEEVPFLSMTLSGLIPLYSGYVNFEADKTEFFLRMAETGVFPSFILTAENASSLIYTNSSDLYSTQYGTYRDTLLEYDARLRALSDQTAGAVILRHEILPNDVTRVSWSNGVTVLVNFGGASATVDGTSVPAGEFVILSNPVASDPAKEAILP